MNTTRAVGILSLSALLTGCGAGGGASTPAGPGGGSPGSPATTALGTRAVPGFVMVVSADQPPLAGATCMLTVDVTPEAGMAAPQAISAGVAGSSAAPSLVSGQPVAGTANRWSWSVTLPASLAGQRVVVQVRDAQGNLSTSGVSDFVLAP